VSAFILISKPNWTQSHRTSQYICPATHRTFCQTVLWPRPDLVKISATFKRTHDITYHSSAGDTQPRRLLSRRLRLCCTARDSHMFNLCRDWSASVRNCTWSARICLKENVERMLEQHVTMVTQSFTLVRNISENTDDILSETIKKILTTKLPGSLEGVSRLDLTQTFTGKSII
jgi:hypothetical protein